MSAAAASDKPTCTRDGRPAERGNTVNRPLTPNRVRSVVENPEYAAFARRILRVCARRAATGDIESLALMAELADTIDTSIRDAVTGLRERGYSWADIGAQLGITRQAAQQHWGTGRVLLTTSLTRTLRDLVFCRVSRVTCRVSRARVGPR